MVWSQRGRLAVNVSQVRILPDDGTFTITRAPTFVAVNGSEASTITYRPTMAGSHRALLQVTPVDGPTTTVVLEGRGVDAKAVPQNSIDFGRPALGASRERTLVLRNDFETPVPITLAFAGGDATEFSVTPSLELPAYGQIETSLEWHPVTKPGPRSVTLALGACPLCAISHLPVKAEAVPVPIVADPSPVQFGAVPVDTERRLPVSLTNLTDEIITVSSIALSPDTDPGYALDPVKLPIQLLPLLPEQLTVTYSPQHLDSGRGSIVVDSNADPTPRLEVPLIASGGGAQLIVEPQTVNFKQVPIGGTGEETVTIRNGSADPQSPPLLITGLNISGAPFSITQGVPNGTALAAGQTATVRVAFQPTAAGPAQGSLAVDSNDPNNPTATVMLVGVGGDTSNCQLQVTPSVLDFGGVVAGQVGSLGAKISNVGVEVCSIWNGAVTGDATFSLERPRPFFQLQPNEDFVAVVDFKPTSSGQFHGVLTFQSSSAAMPQVTIPLTGGSSGACLQPDPDSLGFGEVRLDCGTREQTGLFRNTCNQPITVTSIAFGAGTDAQTFALEETSALPAVLQPNQTVYARVKVQPTKPGYEIWPLFAQDSTDPLPMLMSVDADIQDAAVHNDVYVQPQPNKLDLLWVMDNTASMDTDRANLVQNAARFIQELDSKGIDYHIGVTTTGVSPASPANQTEACPGGVNGGEAGRLFPADNTRPRIIDPTMPDRAQLLAQNLTVGGCNSVQEGLAATELALSPPLVDNDDDPATALPNDGNLGLVRPDAALAIIVASNQDDQSPASVQENINEIRALKPQTPMTFNAIVGPPTGCPNAVQPGTRYLDVAQAIGGVTASVCATDWSQTVSMIADGLLRPRNVFPLAAPPDLATLTVTVDGAAVTNWHYSAGQQSIIFDTAPAAGSTVAIHYDEPCP